MFVIVLMYHRRGYIVKDNIVKFRKKKPKDDNYDVDDCEYIEIIKTPNGKIEVDYNCLSGKSMIEMFVEAIEQCRLNL